MFILKDINFLLPSDALLFDRVIYITKQHLFFNTVVYLTEHYHYDIMYFNFSIK